MGTWESTLKRETISRSRQKQNIVQEKKCKYYSTQETATWLSYEEYLPCQNVK